MINETDVTIEKRWYYEKMSHEIIKKLHNKNFEAYYFVNRQSALKKIISFILTGSSIGLGDSVTLHQIGILDWLTKHKHEYEIYDPFDLSWNNSDKNSWEEFRTARFNVQRKALVADIFLTSTNAITKTGELISMDAHGNRLAPMSFGPGKVIYVCGINKIVDDRTEAIKRIKEYCAPINVKRHYEKHNLKFLEDLPCLHTGKCHNCNSKAKICRILTVIDGWSPIYHAPEEKQPTVVLIGERLGI